MKPRSQHSVKSSILVLVEAYKVSNKESQRSEHLKLKSLLSRMQQAYSTGHNAMSVGRDIENTAFNNPLITLLGYDLQAGTYVETRRSSSQVSNLKDKEIASFIAPYISNTSSVLEVGCGEATRLAGVQLALQAPNLDMLGFDISWSRLKVGCSWLSEHRLNANLFVANLFNIPLSDSSIDVVYTCHSIEPNGGQEEQALRECFRVARKALVIVEPIYELASAEAQARMGHHGYVTGLEKHCLSLPGKVKYFGLLKNYGSHLNPSGVIVIEKNCNANQKLPSEFGFSCPITGSPLDDLGDILFTRNYGLAYPVLRGIPLLRLEHAVVASKLA
jgi:SAM-dependent methyltransferase